jgi:hypothetical protein
LFIKADCNYPGVPVAIKLSSAFLARFKQLPAFLFGFCNSSAKKISIHIVIRNTYLIYTVYLTLSILAHKLPPAAVFDYPFYKNFYSTYLMHWETFRMNNQKQERTTNMYV